jgi:hypothetical protein
MAARKGKKKNRSCTTLNNQILSEKHPNLLQFTDLNGVLSVHLEHVETFCERLDCLMKVKHSRLKLDA